MIKAVAYYRTSSASGVGDDKDSENRQRSAVQKHASINDTVIVKEFYDAAVSGADHLIERDGFNELMDFISSEGIKVILVETVNRIARDVFVQLTGYQLLKSHSVILVPVDDPKHFENIEDNPMAEAIMIIMATLSMLDKKMLCKRMRSGIKKKRLESGRCEGRKPVPVEAVEMARRLRNGGLSLRYISRKLSDSGHRVMKRVKDGDNFKYVVSDIPYGPESIRRMVNNGAP